jgi:hypothetical protein
MANGATAERQAGFPRYLVHLAELFADCAIQTAYGMDFGGNPKQSRTEQKKT